MNVVLSESTWQQVLRYNIHVKAKYVVITNGIYCAAFKHESGHFNMEDKIPFASDL